MVNVTLIMLNIIIGVLIFVITKVILDLFGTQIKEKFKRILPSGTVTDEGEITNG
jgi:hypothetical protein